MFQLTSEMLEVSYMSAYFTLFQFFNASCKTLEYSWTITPLPTVILRLFAAKDKRKIGKYESLVSLPAIVVVLFTLTVTFKVLLLGYLKMALYLLLLLFS